MIIYEKLLCEIFGLRDLDRWFCDVLCHVFRVVREIMMNQVEKIMMMEQIETINEEAAQAMAAVDAKIERIKRSIKRYKRLKKQVQTLDVSIRIERRLQEKEALLWKTRLNVFDEQDRIVAERDRKIAECTAELKNAS